MKTIFNLKIRLSGITLCILGTELFIRIPLDVVCRRHLRNKNLKAWFNTWMNNPIGLEFNK